MKNKHCFNIGKLCNEDENKFWKKIIILKANNDNSINIDINHLKNHYESIFSNSFDVNPINCELILKSIEIFNNKSLFSPIELDCMKFNNALIKIKSSHVCGFDNVSPYT
jgi:hypothetical protein